MARVVATRSIQTSLLCPNSRSPQLSPSTLASRVFFPRENNTTTTASRIVAMRSARAEPELIPVSPEDVPNRVEQFEHVDVQELLDNPVGSMWSKPIVRRKTKIVCTIGPSTNTREMIWKLAEAGMNVASVKY